MMREYTQGKKPELTKVICNGCGTALPIKNDVVLADWLSVDKAWGYFSEKDGVLHSFDLCEECYDRMVKGFVLPVTVKDRKELL